MTADPAGSVTRDLTVAVFVVRNRSVLLLFHQKLGRWLPPGGHVDPNELPDDAARREVFEETGLVAELICDQLNTIDLPGQPLQLCRPAGVQLADISPGHQHIDLVYFATCRGGDPAHDAAWFEQDAWQSLDLTDEVERWCELAVTIIASLAQQ